MSKSQIRTTLITFFNVKDTVLFDFITQGQAVNQAYFVEILKQLRETVHKIRLELWPK
jgi:succinate dehydrogenase flavin-adding protein (antitoxin of CptAB toxin-antitoxin module)